MNRLRTRLRASIASGPLVLLDFISGGLDPRITFSRGSNATLVDATGKITYAPANLVTQSEDFTLWGTTASSVTANVGVAPNGTATADLFTANGAISSHTIAFSATAGISRIFSVYLKADTNNFAQLYFSSDAAPFANFNLATGTVGTVGSNQTATIENAGNGWYRCSIFTNSTTAGNLIIGIISSAAAARAEVINLTTSILVWGAQLEPVTYQTLPSTYVATTASAYYGPRFDYDPVTLAPKGLLIEEARTNLVINSTGFGANWSSGAGSTVAANGGSAPDGTTSATRITVASGTSNNRYNNAPVTVTPGSAYTFSVFLKTVSGGLFQAVILFGATGSARAWLNTSTGAITGLTSVNYTNVSMVATNYGNGWWRAALTATVVTDTTVQVDAEQASASGNYTAPVGDSYLFWGAQLEAGSFATSYIPTVASTVTRSADVATMTGTNFSSWYNQTAGTFVMSLTPIGMPVGGNNTRFLEANDGTGLNRKPLIYSTATGVVTSQTNIAGVTQANLTSVATGIFAPNLNLLLATAYATDDFGASYNGATAVTDTSGSVSNTVTQLTIGYATSSPLELLNGHIRQLAYYNTRLPNAQLQTLTAPSLATTLTMSFTDQAYTVGV